MNLVTGRWARPGARAGLRRVACAAMGAATLALTACLSVPGRSHPDKAAPAILASLQAAGVHDLRGAYREALCRRLRPDGVSCDDVLLRLPGEEALYTASPAADLARRYRVAFVPGMLADCVGTMVRPFGGVERDLAQAGVDVYYLPVAGRGTSAANAERLARQMAALPDDPRPLIVFAHSKATSRSPRGTWSPAIRRKRITSRPSSALRGPCREAFWLTSFDPNTACCCLRCPCSARRAPARRSTTCGAMFGSSGGDSTGLRSPFRCSPS